MTQVIKNPNLILAVLASEETEYLYKLTNAVAGHKVKVFTGQISTSVQLELACKQLGVSKVITTRVDLLKKLLPQGREKRANIQNYAGSLFSLDSVEVLIVPPLKQLVTVAHGSWLMERFLSKLTKPTNWREPSPFNWELLDESQNYNKLKSYAQTSKLCAVDIETSPQLVIRSISYTFWAPDFKTSKTWVLPIKSLADVKLMREINLIPVPKVLQNGKYDIAYLFAYSAPLTSYLYDTVNAMHSWYSELPKDLAFIQALFIRKSMYWKDLAESGDLMEQYGYNAMDTWSTGEVFISWLLEAPDWAKRNYVMEFTQIPICHQMEMTGIKRDMNRLVEENLKHTKILDDTLISIQTSVGHPKFNPSSPKQVATLLKVLGNKDIEDSKESTIQKCILRHPLNERILGAILDYRGDRKLLSTYLPIGEDAKEFRERILYSISPSATDTGRMASKEHHFWCGLQIQNISGTGPVKDTLVADPDGDIFEFDFAQAEARGVGYCSGDEGLIAAVESGKDFHSVNAEAFFGIPYADIYDDVKHKTIDKDLRDLSKRTNHGANYNMGASVMLLTMGEKNVRRAQKILDLPKKWGLVDVCKYLLTRYEETYPRVKGAYYAYIKSQIRATSKLTGSTGWTRWCFGDPSSSKMALNAYVAHVTQSLNAMILNMAMEKVAAKYQFDSRVKFLAQIHDSFLCWIARVPEQLEIAEDIRKLMTFPVPITDCIGITRDMIVPVDIKNNGHRWSGNA